MANNERYERKGGPGPDFGTPRVPHAPVPEVDPVTPALFHTSGSAERVEVVKTRFQLVQDRIRPHYEQALQAIPLMLEIEKENLDALSILAGRRYPFIGDRLLTEIKLRFDMVRQWRIGVAQFEGLSHIDIMCGAGGEIEEKIMHALAVLPETRERIKHLKRLVLQNVSAEEAPEAAFLIAWATPQPEETTPPEEKEAKPAKGTQKV